MLTDLMAASVKGNFDENRERIRDAMRTIGGEQQLEVARGLISLAERRGRRLAMRDIERRIERG